MPQPQSQGQVERIKAGLTSLLVGGNRVVWWSDPDAELSEMALEIDLEGIEIVSLAQESAFALKRRIELDAPKQPFVIYDNQPPPPVESDWLLDVRLYAARFEADATAMLIQDLGLKNQHLRDHLKARARFLASQERVERLQRWLQPDDLEPAIDLKMLAVAVRAEQPDVFHVFSALFSSLAALDEGTEPEGCAAFVAVQKLGLEAPFWAFAKATFGYSAVEPKLWNLLLHLLVTDLGAAVGSSLPVPLKPLLLSGPKAATVCVFLSQWRDSTLRQGAYDVLSSRVGRELNVSDLLADVPLIRLAGCMSFIAVERQLADRIRSALLNDSSDVVTHELRALMTQRLDGYWANPRWPDTPEAPRKTWNAYYLAAQTAMRFFELCQPLPASLRFSSAAECVKRYTDELFEVDQLYRQYHEHADVVDQRGADTLQAVGQKVEDWYLNRFLQPLAQRWDGFIEAGLLEQWQVERLPPQQAFFAREVQKYLSGDADRRVFVVISDALRYEVAEELSQQLNGKNRFLATLSAQLGVLPSYTKLGMASLLPHEALSYNDKGSVLADGQSTEGLDQRSRLLGKHDGLALRAEDFLAMNKAQGREAVKDASVIYVYHNKIDAIGDTASTESETFSACRKAIDELDQIVSRIINNLNGHHVLVTADHGFLFQESDLEALDKNALAQKPGGAVVAKKRYLIGRGLPTVPQAHTGHVRNTAGCDDDMMFWLPKGVARFHFVGGARFVHGGAALQEVVVPVITVRQQRGTKARATEIRKAGVTMLGSNFRVTTNRYAFTLLQAEAVSERVKPVAIRVGLYGPGNMPISNIEHLTLDSEAEDLGQRQRTVSLNLTAGPFNRSDTHHLVISDADTTVELMRTEVKIDLAFTNDFDF